MSWKSITRTVLMTMTQRFKDSLLRSILHTRRGSLTNNQVRKGTSLTLSGVNCAAWKIYGGKEKQRRSRVMLTQKMQSSFTQAWKKYMGLHNEALPQYATYKANSSLITRLLIRDVRTFWATSQQAFINRPKCYWRDSWETPLHRFGWPTNRKWSGRGNQRAAVWQSCRTRWHSTRSI